MHSMHQGQHQAQQHLSGPALLQHLHQDQPQQPQQPQQQQHEQEQEKLNMTVLESLELIQQQPDATGQQQPVLSALDPVQQIHRQQPIIHTLVPVSSSDGTPPSLPPLGPYLHQLHPSRQSIEAHHEQQQQQQQHHHHHHQEQQQQHEQPEIHREENCNSTAQRQQPRPGNGAGGQIEGIVADGGGPIVQWLLENYEISEGESLPRSTVYNHYLAHCRQLRMASVNAASFGKLIRSVFVGLKTRRLGTRGHSKYHYFGVRAKQHVRLDWLQHAESGEGRPGCSSNTSNLMRDSNDNSNQSEANASESDSTGNCSGRLSSSMSNSNQNGKRLRRSNGLAASQEAYMAHHQHDHLAPHNQLDHDQHQLDQNQNQHQQAHYEQSVIMHPANGMYCPVNGYEEKQQQQQDSSPSFGAIHDERAHCWSTPQQLDQYDLSSFRNHLGPNGQTLVDDSWPPCVPTDKPGEPQKQQKQATDKTARPATEDQLAPHLIEHFEGQYRAYYKRMVELLGELQFGQVERLWSEFWRPQANGAPLATHETTTSVHWDMNQQQQLAYHDQQQDAAAQQQPQPQQLIQLATNLTFEQLYQLTSQPAMIERINQIDCKLYSALESFLVVDMLSPLPRALVQHLRAFARNICSWTELAIKDYHPSFVGEKMKTTRAFEQALRRYTSINHLSTASRAIWNRRSAMVQMSIDLSRLDLRDIEDQVSSLMSQEKSHHQPVSQVTDLLASTHELLVSNTTVPVAGQNGDSMQRAAESVIKSTANEHLPVVDMNHSANDNIENNYHNHHHDRANLNKSAAIDLNAPQHQQQLVSHQQTFINLDNQYGSTCSTIQPAQLVQNFLHLLEDPYPANAWPDWCRTLVESRVCGQSFEEARNFILKWNFYISLILRELTLRSAPSLGSFQLIRLLFDEYMYYLVVARLAQAQNKTSTQLLRPSSKFGNI